ncbi:phosphate/phosphite/phosphonate ABC transporter substrate-binding protein [Brevibacillus laterosporus]|uniref:Phosphate/phosphite/phosphonate ABC transporter substrate-binding protein n=1 Tax=Brevibacillus laterosporus TaxID=1465 RepID=A0A518VBL9_BRELA|nr:phosphate/phosphite/phosphonate ABC transporter substrate-binding protein [Brevibacillus laterosporus]QDX94384.1 phosphate/phosphite/phosphonate ABC transporter substrate-binding protein [Brevibacillus laterosporus]
MIRMLRILLFILIALLASGCQNGSSSYQIVFSESEVTSVNSQDDEPSPVRVAISSVLSPSDTIMYYRKIADYLGEKLNRPAILIQRKSYNELSMLMMNGGADIALLSSGAYLTYKQVEGLEAIAMQERMGVPYYYGYLVVNRDSNITDINDLRGKSVAITDPTSYSSYIFVSERLAEFGETPEHFFGSYVYTYNHENSLKAVINRVVDAAAVNSLVYEQAKLKDPELADSLQIISKSEPTGTGPVVISSSLSDEEKKVIKEIFLSMHEEETIKPALQGLCIDRFVPFDPQLYDIAYNARSYKRGGL